MAMQEIKQDIGIGHNIKRLRKAKGMTQEQMVAKLQVMGITVSRTGYNKIENETQHIKVSELMALHTILKADYSDFFQVDAQGQ